MYLSFRHNNIPRFGLGGLGYRPVDFRGMIGGTSMMAKAYTKIKGGMLGGSGRGEQMKKADGGASSDIVDDADDDYNPTSDEIKDQIIKMDVSRQGDDIRDVLKQIKARISSGQPFNFTSSKINNGVLIDIINAIKEKIKKKHHNKKVIIGQQRALEEAETQKKKQQDVEAIQKHKNPKRELHDDFINHILKILKSKLGYRTDKEIVKINSIQKDILSRIKDYNLTSLTGIQNFLFNTYKIDKSTFNQILLRNIDLDKERIKNVIFEDKNILGDDVKVPGHVQAEINQVNKLKGVKGWEGAIRTDDKFNNPFIPWDIDTDDQALYIGEVKAADNRGILKESWKAEFNTTNKTLNSNKGGVITDAFPMEITKIEGWQNTKYYMDKVNNTIESTMVLGHGRSGLNKELIGYFNVYVNDVKKTLTHNFFKDIDDTPDKNDDSKLYYRHNTPEGIELRVKPQFKVPNYETKKKALERKYTLDEFKTLLNIEIQKYSGSKVYYIPYGNLIR